MPEQMLLTTQQKPWKCGLSVWGFLLPQEMMMHLCWLMAECTLKPEPRQASTMKLNRKRLQIRTDSAFNASL